jgi:large subunit ribosomal protein L1
MKRSKNYRSLTERYDRAKEYDLVEAVGILKDGIKTKFDSTMEVHMNLGVDPKYSEQVVRGNVVLPHGTGKKIRVLVFAKGELEKAATAAGADFVGAEEMVTKIQGGWMDFDQVIATPDMMPLVGRIARILGPRGLMPSPKAGTVTMDVVKVLKELKAGKIAFRVDKGGNIHAPVGKASFDKDKLVENARVLIDAVVKAKPPTSKGVYVRSITLAGTMSPGVRVDKGMTRTAGA